MSGIWLMVEEPALSDLVGEVLFLTLAIGQRERELEGVCEAFGFDRELGIASKRGGIRCREGQIEGGRGEETPISTNNENSFLFVGRKLLVRVG